MKITKRQKRNAAKAPNWVRTAAIALHEKPRHKFSRGAASPVRVIVKDGEQVVSDLREAS